MAGLPLRAWHLAPRMATGAFILNSGLSKRGVDAEAAAGMHGMASTAYPQVEEVEPQAFVSKLSAAEIGLGTALLLPFVPTRLAAGALTAFSAGLVGLYARLPGMRQPGSLRPTEKGTALAKDIWLLGIGVGLLTDAMLSRRRD